MASIIKIKRSGTSGAPSTLKLGEMAYSYLAGTEGNGGDRLYMGTGGVDGSGNANEIEVIGGVYFTDKLDHTPGTLTASSAIIVDASSKIDVLNVDNITLNGNTVSTTDTNGNLILSPNGTGAIDAPSGYKDRAGFSINSLTTKEYVDLVAGAHAITITGDIGSDTVNIEDSSLTFDGANGLTTTVTDNSVTIGVGGSGLPNSSLTNSSITISDGSTTDAVSLGETLTFTGTGAVSTAVANNDVEFDLTSTGVSAGTYGSAGAIPSITVDVQGRITSASTVSVSTNLTINADTGSDDINLLDSNLTFTGGTGITTAVTDNTVTITGDDATTSSKGIASFAASDFTVSSGAVSIATGGVSNAQLAGSITNAKLVNSTITISDGIDTDPVSLGGTLLISTSNGIAFAVNGNDSATISGVDATTSSKGVASFSSSDFDVTSGAVTIKTQGVSATQLENTLDLSGKSVTLAAGEISNAELANSSLSINGTSISLGGSGTIDTDDISEGTTNLYYTSARADSDAKNAVSATDAGGDGSFSYDNGTGVFTYTGPSAAEARAHFSAGTGINYNSGTGEFSLPQALDTTDSAVFRTLQVTEDVVIDGNLQVNGTQTIINSETLSVQDAFFYLNQLESDGSPTIAIDVGFAANYNDTGSYAHTGFFRDATDGTWRLFEGYTPEPDSDLDIDIDHASFGYADIRVGNLTATSITGPYAGFDSDLGSAFTDALTEGTFNLYYTTDRVDSALGDILQAGEGITITDGALTYTIAAEDATTTNKGIASFATADFNVTSGAVELKDTVVKTVSTDGSAATPSTHGVTIAGTSAQGITTSGSGSTVTISAANAAADGTTKGVAAFDATHFSAASGVVSANDITLYSGDDQNGQSTGIAATIGESFNIYGDFSQGIQTNITGGNLIVTGRNATVSSKGVASFGAYADSATDPLAIRQFTITSGDVALTTVDGGTY
jgi:hypothetical protein